MTAPLRRVLRPTADSRWLDHLLRALPAARVAVCGDLCLDAYWQLENGPAEPSLETGKPVFRVEGTRYSPGGAGNVAGNLAALGVGAVRVLGVVGSDLFGDELLRQLAVRGLDGSTVMRGSPDWHTLVYAKPYRGAEEQSRFDFGGRGVLTAAERKALLDRLDDAADGCQVVILNQQVDRADGATWCEALNALIARHPGTLFLADFRRDAERLVGAGLKLNVAEAARLSRGDPSADAGELAAALARKIGRPVMVTRGERGLVFARDDALCDVPGIALPGAADSVGAGDAALAGLAAALAVDADPLAAACLANLVAAVTTRKLRTTGTASPEELRRIGPCPDYV